MQYILVLSLAFCSALSFAHISEGEGYIEEGEPALEKPILLITDTQYSNRVRKMTSRSSSMERFESLDLCKTAVKHIHASLLSVGINRRLDYFSYRCVDLETDKSLEAKTFKMPS